MSTYPPDPYPDPVGHLRWHAAHPVCEATPNCALCRLMVAALLSVLFDQTGATNAER